MVAGCPLTALSLDFILCVARIQVFTHTFQRFHREFEEFYDGTFEMLFVRSKRLPLHLSFCGKSDRNRSVH